MLDRIRRTPAPDLWRDTKGGVAMVFSLSLIPLVIAAGLAVDSGRGYLEESRLMSAVDAAALAAANPDLAGRRDVARVAWEYFRRNYGLGDDYIFDTVRITFADLTSPDDLDDIAIESADGRFALEILRQEGENLPDVILSARSTVPTTFMRIAGIPEVDVAVTTQVSGSRMGLELVLVMDNTGSMRGGDKMTRMVQAARGLINRLYLDRFDTQNRFDTELAASGGDVIDTLWVGLVPYAATVNIGRTNQFQQWSEGAGWTYSSFHPTPDPDAAAESPVDHMDWLAPLPLIQIAGYDAWNGHAGPEQPGQSLDSRYQTSVRLEHDTNESDRPICHRDEADIDEDGDTDEYLFETENAGASGLTEAELCHWVEGDPRGWLGCVMSRRDTYNISDIPPDSGVADSLFEPFRWISDSNLDPAGGDDETHQNSFYNAWATSFSNGGSNPIYYGENSRQNGGRGPNLGCPPPITPMTNNYTVIMDAIDTMQPWHRGGTWSHLGMAWGWRVLSPRWRDQWSLPYEFEGERLPLEYDNDEIRKVAVVLTDGRNEWYQDDFTAHGYRTESRSIADGGFATTHEPTATARANDRMQTICRAMRGESVDDGAEDNDRIIIYTIVLADESQRTTFENCASEQDHYFFAQNSSDLENIFSQIADDLSALRISK